MAGKKNYVSCHIPRHPPPEKRPANQSKETYHQPLKKKKPTGRKTNQKSIDTRDSQTPSSKSGIEPETRTFWPHMLTSRASEEKLRKYRFELQKRWKKNLEKSFHVVTPKSTGQKCMKWFGLLRDKTSDGYPLYNVFNVVT